MTTCTLVCLLFVIGLCLADEYEERRLAAAQLAHEQGNALIGIVTPCAEAHRDQDITPYVDNLNEAVRNLKTLKREAKQAKDKEAMRTINDDLKHAQKLLREARAVMRLNSKIQEQLEKIAHSTAELVDDPSNEDTDTPTVTEAPTEPAPTCWYTPADRDSTECNSAFHQSGWVNPANVNIVFTNTLPVPVVTKWQDYQGNEQEYSTIPAGGSFTQGTYQTHGWVAWATFDCDGDGITKRVKLNGECDYAATGATMQEVTISL